MALLELILDSSVDQFQVQSDEQKVRAKEVRHLRNQRQDRTDEQIETAEKLKEQNGFTRELLLDGLTSDYDLDLFREAQARVSPDTVVLWNISHFARPIIITTNKPTTIKP